MEYDEGVLVGRVAMDAISFVQERMDDAKMLSVIVSLCVKDNDGNIGIVTRTWPNEL